MIDNGTWPNSGIGRINLDGSLGTCAACHSRHRFSLAMARRPELSQVSGNERTATILLHGRGLEPHAFATLARQAGWFELDAAGPVTRPPTGALAGLFLILAVVQAYRGQVMVPAVGFLWNAWELLRREDRDGG